MLQDKMMVDSYAHAAPPMKVGAEVMNMAEMERPFSNPNPNPNLTCRLLSCFLCDGNVYEQSLHYEKDFSKTLTRTNSVTDNMMMVTDNYEVDLSHFTNCNRVIGLGGFGLVRTVIKKTGRDKGRKYAIKSISKAAVLLRNSGLSTVNSELLVLTKISNCEQICNLHYAFQDSSFLYMVFDLAKCGDMRHFLRNFAKTKFFEENCRAYFYQICLAIDYCHKKNILHRDVKPENIVITERGVLKLTDFGVAKLLERIDDCRSTSGTHGYMAPEIYQNVHIHGRSADWFSLGITLHEFLTGRRPFEIQRLQSFKYPGHRDELHLTFLEKITGISSSCKDLMRLLLQPQACYRLGTNLGLQEIMDQEWMQGFSLATSKSSITNIPYFDRNFMLEEDSQQAIHKHLSSLPIDPKSQYMFENYYFNKWTSSINVQVPKSDAQSIEDNPQNFQMSKHLKSSSSCLSNEQPTAIATMAPPSPTSFVSKHSAKAGNGSGKFFETMTP